jgi:hypothetical protein
VFRRLALVAALILAVFALPVGASADGRELRAPACVDDPGDP